MKLAVMLRPTGPSAAKTLVTARSVRPMARAAEIAIQAKADILRFPSLLIQRNDRYKIVGDKAHLVNPPMWEGRRLPSLEGEES